MAKKDPTTEKETTKTDVFGSPIGNAANVESDAVEKRGAEKKSDGPSLRDLGGLALIALALMTLVAFFSADSAGGLLTGWSNILQRWFGWGTVWVSLAIGLAGAWLLRRPAKSVRELPWVRIVAFTITAFITLLLFDIIGRALKLPVKQSGGIIGWIPVELMTIIFEPLGTIGGILIVLILGGILVASLLVGLGIYRPLIEMVQNMGDTLGDGDLESMISEPAVVEAPIDGVQLTPESASDQASTKKKRLKVSPEFRKSFRIEQDEELRPASLQDRDERLPPIDLLVKERSTKPDERSINQTAGLIEQTLAEFGIPATVVDFQVGPTVTQFAVVPGYVEKEKGSDAREIERQKVRVAQIASLRRDLALALAAERLRIQAPVPGRPYIGIEVPNTRSVVVRLRPILESEIFYKINSPLTIGLGRDVSGQPVVADLALMPHLLVAGATGSGKSVCIAAITTCLVMNNTPDDLRLVIVDPKMVELVRFNGLPHLLGKVETDIERILAVLRWTVKEMDRRYLLLEESRSRNIDTYNRKARRRKNIETLPRLVVLIDELADLMMTSPDQTEHNLVRLAQMARATGIHLIVSTQRPSTDVVTGLIKANFPARISFSVASSVDSRVILDTVGGEHLLGRGDMLFLPPEAPAPIRAQGVMVNDQEVERVINFWQKSYVSSKGDELAPWDALLKEEAALAAKDPLLTKAVEIVRDTQRASASLLQRQLRIGYPRAARLIDEMESMGVVGPPQKGGKEREVFISKEDEAPPA